MHHAKAHLSALFHVKQTHKYPNPSPWERAPARECLNKLNKPSKQKPHPTLWPLHPSAAGAASHKYPNHLPVGACPCARMSEQAQQAFNAKASSNPSAISPFGRRGSLPQIPESPARHSHNTFGRGGSLPQIPESPPRGSVPLRANV